MQALAHENYMKKILTLLVMSTYLLGCATPSGFNRTELNKQLIITDEQIQQALDAKPQLHTPFKVAIYFRPNEQYWAWNWEQEDKYKLNNLGKELKNKNIVSDYVILNQATIDGDSIKSIRLAAAQHGADAVLIISGASQLDKYNNSLGITYFLIITGFFVPGSVIDGIFLSHAGVWDVRNGYLYLSTEAEVKTSETAPMFFSGRELHDKIRRNIKSESLDKLIENIRNHIETELNNAANNTLKRDAKQHAPLN
jgi:rhombotail lipoprotein